ncbi:RCC1-like G exchanging factor-like protein [Apodemus speciosus]|uniref:RCC1-like G exchanging factor-like protein n=1 Tax=Apodemus speciosus TaxID=105296 RepID=A0ABQ0ET65_APOSI
MGLQLLRGSRSAQLRGAVRGARTARRPAAPTQDPARALPPGAGP